MQSSVRASAATMFAHSHRVRRCSANGYHWVSRCVFTTIGKHGARREVTASVRVRGC